MNYTHDYRYFICSPDVDERSFEKEENSFSEIDNNFKSKEIGE